MYECKQYTKNSIILPPETCMDWAKKEYVDKAPVMVFRGPYVTAIRRLLSPMSLEQKVEFFKLLVADWV